MKAKKINIRIDPEIQELAKEMSLGPLGQDAVARYWFNRPEGIPVIQALLDAVLDRKVTVVKISTQHHFPGHPLAQNKEGIVDIYAETAEGEIFLIELQRDTDRERFSHERMLIYGSLAVSELVEKGGKYQQLNPVCIIMVSEKDPLGEGLPQYTLEYRVRETGKLAKEYEFLKNAPEFIYVNASAKGNSPAGQIAKDIMHGTEETAAVPEVKAALKQLRNTESEDLTMDFEQKLQALLDRREQQVAQRVTEQVKAEEQARYRELEKRYEALFARIEQLEKKNG